MVGAFSSLSLFLYPSTAAVEHSAVRCLFDPEPDLRLRFSTGNAYGEKYALHFKQAKLSKTMKIWSCHQIRILSQRDGRVVSRWLMPPADEPEGGIE